MKMAEFSFLSPNNFSVPAVVNYVQVNIVMDLSTLRLDHLFRWDILLVGYFDRLGLMAQEPGSDS